MTRLPRSLFPEGQKEVFRRGGESLAPAEQAMWDAVAVMRQEIGEKAFRQRLFAISVVAAFKKVVPGWAEAERYRPADVVVKLSEMLDAPPPAGPIKTEHAGNNRWPDHYPVGWATGPTTCYGPRFGRGERRRQRR